MNANDLPGVPVDVLAILQAAARKVVKYLDYPGNGRPIIGCGAATAELCVETLRRALRGEPPVT